MDSRRKKPEGWQFKIVNKLGRIFGVLLIILGVYGFVAFAIPDHAWGDLVMGILCIVFGIAFIKVKPTDPEHFRQQRK